MLVELAFAVLAVIIVVAAIAGARSRRSRQLQRISTIAGGDYVFTFDSNGWYQTAVLELQRQKIIDPAIPSDNASPLTRGPRWVSASSLGITVWRGYDAMPVVTFPWSGVGAVFAALHRSPGSRNGPQPGLTVTVRATDGEVQLVLLSPSAALSLVTNLAQARAVARELKSIRAAGSGARSHQPDI